MISETTKLPPLLGWLTDFIARSRKAIGCRMHCNSQIASYTSRSINIRRIQFVVKSCKLPLFLATMAARWHRVQLEVHLFLGFGFDVWIGNIVLDVS